MKKRNRVLSSPKHRSAIVGVPPRELSPVLGGVDQATPLICQGVKLFDNNPADGADRRR